VSSAVRETLFLAALLGGEGARAAALADRGASVLAAMRGRSCIEAGAPLQLTADAPGPPGLRFGLPVSDPGALLGGAAAESVREALSRLGPSSFAPSSPLGLWGFLGPRGGSVHADVRDGSARVALSRAAPLLGEEGRSRLVRLADCLDGVEPWTLGLTPREGQCTIRLGLRLFREREPGPVAARLGLAAEYAQAEPLLAALLGGRPSALHQPWLLRVTLEGPQGPELRLGTSFWSRRPDDDAKRGVLRDAMTREGGDADHAEALHSLLRGRVPTGRRWVVLRAFEVHVAGGTRRFRGIFVPWLAESH